MTKPFTWLKVILKEKCYSVIFHLAQKLEKMNLNYCIGDLDCVKIAGKLKQVTKKDILFGGSY